MKCTGCTEKHGWDDQRIASNNQACSRSPPKKSTLLALQTTWPCALSPCTGNGHIDLDLYSSRETNLTLVGPGGVKVNLPFMLHISSQTRVRKPSIPIKIAVQRLIRSAVFESWCSERNPRWGHRQVSRQPSIGVLPPVNVPSSFQNPQNVIILAYILIQGRITVHLKLSQELDGEFAFLPCQLPNCGSSCVSQQ